MKSLKQLVKPQQSFSRTQIFGSLSCLISFLIELAPLKHLYIARKRKILSISTNEINCFWVEVSVWLSVRSLCSRLFEVSNFLVCFCWFSFFSFEIAVLFLLELLFIWCFGGTLQIRRSSIFCSFISLSSLWHIEFTLNRPFLQSSSFNNLQAATIYSSVGQWMSSTHKHNNCIQFSSSLTFRIENSLSFYFFFWMKFFIFLSYTVQYIFQIFRLEKTFGFICWQSFFVHIECGKFMDRCFSVQVNNWIRQK